MQIAFVKNKEEGVEKAKEILTKVIDNKTVLFLSGGKTPEPFYQLLAKEETLQLAAVGMIDERFGDKWHGASNELMIKNTGLLAMLNHRDIPFHPMLQNLSLEETAKQYDKKVRELFFHFPTSMGILGIGGDGHTAGIPAGNSKSETRNSKFSSEELVVSYDLAKYGQRVTMTFTALSLLDTIIILAFGKDKQTALKQMFVSGSLEEIPARFYTKPEISDKVTLITDQVI